MKTKLVNKMAQNNSKLIAMIAVMLFTAIGIVIAYFLTKLILDYNATGVLANIKDILTNNNNGLLLGLLWLIVCIITYIGVSKVYSGEKVGILSLFFFLLWFSAVIGLFIGNVLWALIDNQTVTFNLDFIINSITTNLVISLIPTLAAALSISNS